MAAYKRTLLWTTKQTSYLKQVDAIHQGNILKTFNYSKMCILGLENNKALTG